MLTLMQMTCFADSTCDDEDAFPRAFMHPDEDSMWIYSSIDVENELDTLILGGFYYGSYQNFPGILVTRAGWSEDELTHELTGYQGTGTIDYAAIIHLIPL